MDIHTLRDVVVCTLHWYFSVDHLGHVVDEMRARGAPRLRGFVDRESGAVLLREGTHRARAAHHLGVAPVILPIRWWRSRDSLERAVFATIYRGLLFDRVVIDASTLPKPTEAG